MADANFNAGPVGKDGHTVEQGDCLESIAFQEGFAWKTLFDLPENRDLKDARGCHNILLPGDAVHVPDPAVKEVEVPTDTDKHVFVRSGAQTTILIRIRNRGKKVEDQPYALTLGEEPEIGMTGAAAEIEATRNVLEREGSLSLGEEGSEQEFEILLGHLDPITELSGVKGRLNNLGYDCGSPDHRENPETTYALQVFQATHGLKVTGIPDEDTRDRLLQVHEN